MSKFDRMSTTLEEQLIIKNKQTTSETNEGTSPDPKYTKNPVYEDSNSKKKTETKPKEATKKAEKKEIKVVEDTTEKEEIELEAPLDKYDKDESFQYWLTVTLENVKTKYSKLQN